MFGLAGGLIGAGIVCAVVIGGTTGQIVALALIGIGLVLATSLVFLEVGLSEDRERAGASKRPAPSRAGTAKRVQGTRLERSRSHRRRLR